MKNSYIKNHLHLSVQQAIRKKIQSTDVHLEYRLKGHVADIFWESKKIVFEVQCSPISLKEAIRRTTDYEKLNMTIIWVLHDKTYNKINMSPSEEFLVKKKNVFYSNISQHGEGIIFDQEEAFLDARRLIKSPPLEISLSLPYRKKFSKKIYFKGDRYSIDIIQRIRLYPSIWRIKIKNLSVITKRFFIYYKEMYFHLIEL